jgi:hypothetical protein
MAWLTRAGMLVVLAAIAMKFALQVPREDLFADGPPSFDSADRIALILASLTGLALAGLSWRDGRDGSSIGPWAAVAILVMIATSVVLAAIMVMDPTLFDTILLEDGVAEWTSAVLLFAGAACAGIAVARGRHAPWIKRLLLIGLLLVALVIGLEEVSWFQRQLGYTTPEWLARENVQGEFNFHNTSTGLWETLYCTGTALLFVGGRALLALPERPAFVAGLRSYAPAAPAFVAGALACACNWDMWQSVLIEAGTALALGVLLVEIVVARRAGRSGAALLFGLTLVTGIAVQAMFLVWGSGMVRQWDATEMREWLIAAAIALYALQFALRPQPASAAALYAGRA